MEDHGISVNEHCPCVQEQCRIRGNCVVCIQNHLTHGEHVPECIQDMLRDKFEPLAKMLELKTGEGRPNAAFWETFDRDGQPAKSVKRHGEEGPGDEL